MYTNHDLRQRRVEILHGMSKKPTPPTLAGICPMKWPLRNQIMLPLLAVSLVSLTAVGVIYARMATRQTREQIESRLQGVVGVLSATNFPLTDSVLRQMRELSSAEFVLVDAQGKVEASSLRETPKFAQALPLSDAGDKLLGPTIDVEGVPYFHASLQLGNSDIRRHRTLHILFPQSEYQRHWREAFVPPLVVGIVAIAAVAAVAHVVAGRISRATATLGREVLRLARGDFAAFELPRTDDEIRDLSIAVNRTAELLADYERQVRRTEQIRTVAMLGASLAHEMRNAATGCRMALDLHAENCLAHGDEETLVVAKRQLRLMESQLQRLLQIGKAPVPARQDAVDLGKLIEDIIPLVQPAAQHADVELDWELPVQTLSACGDQEQLSQAVLNLILNALEAARQGKPSSPACRRVAVELSRQNGRAELAVSDTGPGPAGSVTASLFDPFVTTKPEGAGLGLAVARQVVEAHHGTIEWLRDADVTRFCVSLPLSNKGEH